MADSLPPFTGVERLLGAVNRGVADEGVAKELLATARHGGRKDRAAVLGALENATASWWVTIDRSLRMAWCSAPGWSRALREGKGEGFTGRAELLLLIVAAADGDVRVREWAVTGLAEAAAPFTLGLVDILLGVRRQPNLPLAAAPMLALRAGDRSCEVRMAARMVLVRRATLLSEPVVAELAFVPAVSVFGTWLAGQVVKVVPRLPPERLEPLLASRDRRTRRAVHEAAIQAGLLGPDRLLEVATRDANAATRALAAQELLRTPADPARLHALLAGGVPLVRARALQVLVDEDRSGVLPEAAVTALTDRRRLVRGVAQAALRLFGEDPAAQYRQRAGTAGLSPAVVSGLGETGDASDVPLVASGLRHPRARVRVAAVQALQLLGAVNSDDLVPLLRDESRAVTRQAVNALLPEAGSLGRGMLLDLLRQDQPQHVRVAGFRLLQARGHWDRLVAALHLAAGKDPGLGMTGVATVERWLTADTAGSWRDPGPERRAEVRALVEVPGTRLSEDLARRVRFHASFGGLPALKFQPR